MYYIFPVKNTIEFKLVLQSNNYKKFDTMQHELQDKI